MYIKCCQKILNTLPLIVVHIHKHTLYSDHTLFYKIGFSLWQLFNVNWSYLSIISHDRLNSEAGLELLNRIVIRPEIKDADVKDAKDRFVFNFSTIFNLILIHKLLNLTRSSRLEDAPFISFLPRGDEFKTSVNLITFLWKKLFPQYFFDQKISYLVYVYRVVVKYLTI